MTAKEYLKQIWWTEKDIKNKLELIEIIRAKAEGLSSPQISDMPRGGQQQDPASLIVKLAELDNYINEQKNELISLKTDVIKQINKITDQRSCLILTCRYVQTQKWSEIEKNMHYEHRYMMKLHEKALQEFEEANPQIKRIKQKRHKKTH